MRFNEGRVVVAFNFEHRGQSIADVHHPGVFARPFDHPRPFGRQGFEMRLGAFITAMLAPHGGKNSQLDQIRFPLQQVGNTGVLFLGDAVVGNLFRADEGEIGSAHTLAAPSDSIND